MLYTPNAQRLTFAVALATGLLGSQPLLAADARSIALGGSAIANGRGVHGTLENPATLMRLQRNGEGFHFHVGVSADIRDNADLVQIASDNETLDDDIDDEINRLSGQTVSCDPITATADTVCLNGTAELGNLSTRVLEIFDDIDGKSVEGKGDFDLGVAMTRNQYPFALHLKISGVGAGEPGVAQSDRDYVGTFANTLSDDVLTYQEVLDNSSMAIANGNTLELQQPEDVLQSEINGRGLLRTQFGVSLATTVAVGGMDVDIGATPKFSKLRAGNIDTTLSDLFDDTTSLTDQFDDSEVSESSFTVDLGASVALKKVPVQVAAVLRNLIPESIKTHTGYEFETTPQLIVGSHFQRGILSLTADLALNSAKVDNFETQPLALGMELDLGLAALRAGISHDAARDDDNTALSLGLGLGAFQIGGRVSSANAAQFGLQVAHSF